jgi:hypothetical protein
MGNNDDNSIDEWSPKKPWLLFIDTKEMNFTN